MISNCLTLNALNLHHVSHLKDLKASYVQHSYEVLPLHLGVQGLVNPSHHPLEHTVVDGFGQSPDGVHTLVLVLT